MRHIIVRDFGPLTNADVYLEKINFVVGPQSSGKSCLLKIASFCAWLEKRIQRSQDYKQFEANGAFETKLTGFHKLEGYINAKSFVSYENDTMKFSYEFSSKKFDFEWKKKRWNYRGVKVSYIPAERNMVSVIPNWFEITLKGDNIQSFMSDWQDSRISLKKDLPILNLGVRYRYDKVTQRDYIVLSEGRELPLTNTSSGLQSLVPLYVHLNHLYKSRFTSSGELSWGKGQENKRIMQLLYNNMYGSKNIDITNAVVVDDVPFLFADKKHASDFVKRYSTFVENKYNDVFLEEPEENLFPPTQSVLINTLIDYAKGVHGNCLFVATHSPYVLTSVLERKDLKSLALFMAKSEGNGRYSIVTANDEDINDIYKYGLDVFYNIETLTDDK